MLTSLRTILRSAARSLGVERAANSAFIEELWPDIVGKEAAAHSRPTELRGGILLVETEAGMWAQELSAQRGRFVAEINRVLGSKTVTDIRFRQIASWRPKINRQNNRTTPPEDEDANPTPEEMAAIDRVVSEIADPEVREAARRAMLSQAGWRKRAVRASGR